MVVGKRSHGSVDYLLKVLASGDKDAFNDFFSLYYPKVKSFAMRLCNDDFMAEDIAQDIFMQLWVRRKELCSISNINFYLYVATRNSSIKAIRQWMRKRQLDGVDCPSDIQADEEIDMEELLNELKKHITSMPKQQRKVFLLSRRDGLSNKQIAGLLGLSVRTVENHIAAALRTLREAQIIVSLMFCSYLIG